MAQAPRPLPPARPRTRRVIAVDDNVAAAQPEPAPTAEGTFIYGDSLSAEPAVRYRQIKAVEGGSSARVYAKQQMLRMAMAGVRDEDIAKTFQFGLTWTRALLTEARKEMREAAVTRFDGMGVIAEHVQMFRSLRESAFFALQRGGSSEVDKHRARDSLMTVMRNEFEFIEKVGGFRGVSLQASNEDESVTAVRALSGAINGVIDALVDAAHGPIDDIGDEDAIDIPGDPGGGPGGDGAGGGWQDPAARSLGDTGGIPAEPEPGDTLDPDGDDFADTEDSAGGWDTRIDDGPGLPPARVRTRA